VHSYHGKVEVGTEATVEANLFLAVKAATVQGAEVQESEVDWLLDLVDVAVGQKEVGDVGLDELHRAGGLGVRGGLQE